jgi:hypothetical protein
VTATQNEGLAHDTAFSPSELGMICRGDDQDDPLKVDSPPAAPTATQKVVVGHDTELGKRLEVPIAAGAPQVAATGTTVAVGGAGVAFAVAVAGADDEGAVVLAPHPLAVASSSTASTQPALDAI